VIRRTLLLVPFLALAAAGPMAGPTAGQAPDPEPYGFRVSVMLGTMGFTDLQAQPLRAARTAPNGEDEDDAAPPESVRLTRRLGVEGGRMASLSIGLGMGRSWAVRVGAGIGSGTLARSLDGPDEWVEEAREVADTDAVDFGLMALSSALQYRIPTPYAFRPYLELGASLERWTADTSLPAGDGESDEVTRLAGMVAVGGDYPVTQRIALSLRLGTTVFRTPLTPRLAGQEVGRSDSLVLTTEAPDTRRFSDTAVELARSTRVSVGLTVRLGGAVAEPPDPPESGASPPADLR
jgi:hypothetical protein